jgi:hypothetical protein
MNRILSHGGESMSSIEATDRNSQMNENQQVRESYDSRENELVQRHKRELAELKQHNQETLAKIKSEYDQELTSMRTDSRQALTTKEKQHLREIQGMQEAGRKRFERVKSEDDEKYDVTKKTLEGENARLRSKDSEDTNRLTRHFDQEIHDRDEESSDNEVTTRDGSQHALKDQAKRFNEKIDDERNYYQNYIRERDRQTNQEVTALNRGREKEVNDLKTKNSRQQREMDSKYQDNLRHERENFNKNVGNLEQDFQQGMRENKEKFKGRSEQLTEEFHSNFENLNDSTSKRVDDEVMSVRRENLNLKADNQVAKHDGTKQKEREKRDLTDGFQKNINELETRRQAAVKDSNQEKARDINYIHRVKDKQLGQMQNNFELKMAENELKHSGEFDGEIIQANRQRELEKIQHDRQEKKLYEVFADSTVSQANFHEDQVDMLKKNNEKQLGENRGLAEKTRMDELQRVQSQLAKENVAHQEKLVDTVSTYERQLATTRVDYEKKLRRQADLFRDQTTKQVKGLQMDREASEQKLQARMGQMKESYERELDQLRKRQLQERQDLALKKS